MLTMLLSGCPYLVDAEFHAGPWVSGLGIPYPYGAVTMPEGMWPGIDFAGDGPFHLVNEYFIPRCIENQPMLGGMSLRQIAESAGEPCLRLFEPCTAANPCGDGEVDLIRRVSTMLGGLFALEGVVIPEGVGLGTRPNGNDDVPDQEPLVVRRARLGWRLQLYWPPYNPLNAMLTPVIRLVLDLDRFSYMPEEPIEVEGKWIVEVRVPKVSLEMWIEPRVSPDGLHSFVLRSIDSSWYRNWTDPVVMNTCYYDYNLPGCEPDFSLDDYFAQFTHYIAGCPGMPDEFNAGLGSIQIGRKWDGQTPYCLNCSRQVFEEAYIGRYAEYFCLQFRLENKLWWSSYNQLANATYAPYYEKLALWGIVEGVLVGILRAELGNALDAPARLMFFNPGMLHTLSGGRWDSAFLPQAMAQDPLSPDNEVLLVRTSRDTDRDGVPDFGSGGPSDPLDNCRNQKNQDQLDCDGDGLGDVCDDTLCVTGLGWSSVTFGDRWSTMINPVVRLLVRTTGGAHHLDYEGERRRVETYWCDCPGMNDVSCARDFCKEDGEDHQNEAGPYRGWFPVTWVENSLLPPACAADQSCPPIPGVEFNRRCPDDDLDRGDDRCERETRAVTWHWREQKFPPDGLGLEQPGHRFVKLRGLPLVEGPPDRDAAYTFRSVGKLEYRWEWQYTVMPGMDALRHGEDLLDPIEFQVHEPLLEDPRRRWPWLHHAELLGAMEVETAGGPVDLPVTVHLDQDTGQVSGFSSLAFEPDPAAGMQVRDFASLAVARDGRVERYAYGGRTAGGDYSDDLWTGRADSQVSWRRLQTGPDSPRTAHLAVGPMPAEINLNPIAIDHGQRLAYVTSQDAGEISVVDLDTFSLVATIPGLDRPAGLASRFLNQELWVADSGSNSIAIVDTDTWSIAERIDLGPNEPGLVVMDPRRQRAFVRARTQVENRWWWSLLLVDTLTRTPITQQAYDYHDFDNTDALVVSPDGTRLFVARDNYELIDVYDAFTLELVETVDLGRSATGIALSRDGALLVVTNLREDSVSLIDPDTWSELAVIGGIQMPAAVALDRTGTLAVVTNLGHGPEPDAVTVIDLAGARVAYQLPVGDWPTAIELSGSGQAAYVVNSRSGSITAIERLAIEHGTPGARAGAELLPGPGAKTLRLLGGQTATGLSAEQWELDLDGGTWSLVSAGAAAGPGPGAFRATARDPGTGGVYLYGGEADAGVSAELWRYDPPSGRFAQLGPLSRGPGPQARAGAALAHIPEMGALYLFGGRDGSQRSMNDSWLYSLADRSWRSITPDCSREPCPPARHGAAAVVLDGGNRIAIVGGTTEDRSSALLPWVQDLRSSAWHRPDQPSEQPGIWPGGLKRIDYRGKRLDRRAAEGFQAGGLVAAFEPGSNRSFRWIGQVRIDQPGEYQFGVESRGGCRLFLDGRLVEMEKPPADTLGSCAARSATSQRMSMEAGWHDLVVDLSVCRQGGRIELSLTDGSRVAGPIPADRLRYRASGGLIRRGYFPFLWWLWETGEDFDQSPADDDWGQGAPGVLGVRWPNHFAVGWDGMLRIDTAGEYRFVSDTDDGARLELGGKRLIDDLWGRAGTRVSAPIRLEPGWHDLRFVVRERQGQAHAKLGFHASCPELAGQGLPASRCAARFDP